jgi:hypothetical protein
MAGSRAKEMIVAVLAMKFGVGWGGNSLHSIDNHNTSECMKTVFWGVYLVRLGFELRALLLQSRCSTAQATPPLPLALIILEIGSHELYSSAGLELRSS